MKKDTVRAIEIRRGMFGDVPENAEPSKYTFYVGMHTVYCMIPGEGNETGIFQWEMHGPDGLADRVRQTGNTYTAYRAALMAYMELMVYFDKRVSIDLRDKTV